MKRLFTLSVLFAVLFTILATNNSAIAQPESFTENFLMENYRGNQVVNRRTVTVRWDATANKMYIDNFYVSDYAYYSPAPVMTLGVDQAIIVTWETNTHATFKWREHYYGEMQKDVFVYHKSRYNNSKKWFFGFISPASPNTGATRYLSAFDGTQTEYGLSGGYHQGTIDLEEGIITMGAWGHFIREDRSGGHVGVVEWFEHSVMKRTNLVDIVNDGNVGNDYTVNDDLVGVKVVDNVPAEGIEFDDNTTQNTFKIAPGKYKLEVELDNNKKPISLRVSQASLTAELTPWNVDFGENTRVHIFGQVNDYNINYWDPTQGQRMETTDGVHYSAIVNFYDRGDGYSYFSITTDLAQNNDDGGWSYVNGKRYGPSNNNFPISLGKVLFAKDLGKYKYPSLLIDDQDDFMGRVKAKDMYEEKVHPAADYDQSNWVMLTGLNNPGDFVGYLIKGKSIKGTLVDKVNPTIAVTSTPEQGDQHRYEPNLYIMPSFNEDYYAPTSNFFFVAPKVQEYAYITWACYNDADGNFYTMSDGNTSNLTGGVKVNWDYYPDGNPQDGYVYEFDAIVRKVASTTNGAPLLKDGNQSTPVTGVLSDDYMVYPLRLYDVPTAINSVEVAGKVVNVKYYNLMGVESSTPFDGVNIVVTTYDNGSRITSKKLY
jgi:hypothetical protein